MNIICKICYLLEQESNISTNLRIQYCKLLEIIEKEENSSKTINYNAQIINTLKEYNITL